MNIVYHLFIINHDLNVINPYNIDYDYDSGHDQKHSLAHNLNGLILL